MPASQVTSIFTQYISVAIFNSCVYGIYLTLFVLCLYILVSGKRAGYRWRLATTVLLFAMSTLYVVVHLESYWYTYLLQYQHQDYVELQAAGALPDFIALHVLHGVAIITSSFIADVVLIQRCYVVWGRNWKVIALPALLALALLGTGISTDTSPRADPLSPFVDSWAVERFQVFYAISLATNVMVTSLTAGRIWYVAREASRYLQELGDVRRAYKTAIAIIIESGAAYSLVLLAVDIMFNITLRNPRPDLLVVMDCLVSLSTFMSGITPTLLIVRVGFSDTATGSRASERSDRKISWSVRPGPSRSHWSGHDTLAEQGRYGMRSLQKRDSGLTASSERMGGSAEGPSHWKMAERLDDETRTGGALPAGAI